MDDTSFVPVKAAGKLGYGPGGEARIERIVVEGHERIRFSWWKNDRVRRHPLHLDEEELLRLIAESIAQDVFSPRFLCDMGTVLQGQRLRMRAQDLREDDLLQVIKERTDEGHLAWPFLEKLRRIALGRSTLHGSVSDHVVGELSLGKYSRWADCLHPDSLEMLLWAIGVYGEIAGEVKRRCGEFPVPKFEKHHMAEERMRFALEVIPAIQSGQRRSDATLPQSGRQWSKQWELSADRPGFLWRFRSRLATDPMTRWASELDELSLWCLLWQVGEFGCRMNGESIGRDDEYPPPRFGLPPSDEDPLRAALRLIAHIEGNRLTAVPDEVKAAIVRRSGDDPAH